METESEKVIKKSFLSDLERKLLNKDFPLQLINRDLLKYIALALMTLGHWQLAVYALFHSKPLLMIVGALEFFAPPVFFFFISEGFHYTKSRSKYAIRLLIFAVITQIPHSLTLAGGLTVHNLLLQWSVLMTLFLGLAALIVLHCDWKLPLRILAIAALMGISWLLNCEWAVSGIMIILLFDLLREKPLIRLASYMALMYGILCVSLGSLPNTSLFFIYLLPEWAAGIVITFFYNGNKGHFPLFSKYFFYVWYPLHLFLQWLFQMIAK